eukprot:1068684-Pelagomonas_calceolata.AAC.7
MLGDGMHSGEVKHQRAGQLDLKAPFQAVAQLCCTQRVHASCAKVQVGCKQSLGSPELVKKTPAGHVEVKKKSIQGRAPWSTAAKESFCFHGRNRACSARKKCSNQKKRLCCSCNSCIPETQSRIFSVANIVVVKACKKGDAPAGLQIFACFGCVAVVNIQHVCQA